MAHGPWPLAHGRRRLVHLMVADFHKITDKNMDDCAVNRSMIVPSYELAQLLSETRTPSFIPSLFLSSACGRRHHRR